MRCSGPPRTRERTSRSSVGEARGGRRVEHSPVMGGICSASKRESCDDAVGGAFADAAPARDTLTSERAGGGCQAAPLRADYRQQPSGIPECRGTALRGRRRRRDAYLLSMRGFEPLLFVAPDAVTSSLNPRLIVAGAHAGPKSSAVSSVVARDARCLAAGAHTEFLVFYSGPLRRRRRRRLRVLECQRLTRTLLFSLLSRSPANHNHVLVDACKSYFLVFDRGARGRRTPYAGSLAEEVPARLGNTGFILSTSSEPRQPLNVSANQGGILSISCARD